MQELHWIIAALAAVALLAAFFGAWALLALASGVLA